jgi:hypothetical protein
MINWTENKLKLKLTGWWGKSQTKKQPIGHPGLLGVDCAANNPIS